jgi:hypothetical protein
MALSYSQLSTQFLTLSQNNTTANTTLANFLINQEHRYLLLRYFDNEKSFTLTTVGPQILTLTATPVVGVVGTQSATLEATWPYPSCQQLVVFGDSEQRTVFFTQGSTNIYWQSPLFGQQFLTTNVIAAGATSATLSSAWTTANQTSTTSFSDGSTKSVTFTQGSANISWTGGLVEQVQAYVYVIPTNTSISCVGQQSYRLPANISKLKTTSITIGQLVYQAYPVNSVQEWVKVNALPYTASYPAYFFLYNNELQFWPIPSQTGYIITLYAQINTPDLSYADVTGTVASSGTSVGSNIVTASGSPFSVFPQGVDLTFTNLQFVAAPPSGDGLNYPIQEFTSNTSATLLKPIVYSPSQTGTGTFTIGQYPLLDGDFHDAILYGALRTYFSSISKDTDKAGYFGGLYQERLGRMEYYLSNKQSNVDLGSSPLIRNPNLYPYPTSSNV